MNPHVRRTRSTTAPRRRRPRALAATVCSALVLLAALVPATATVAAAAGRTPAGAVLTGRGSKLSPRLQTLRQPQAVALAGAAQSQAVGLAATGAGSLMQRPGGRVVVQIRFNDTSTATLDALRAAGVSDLSLSASDGVANGVVSPDELAAVAAVPGVASVREEITPMVGSAAAARAALAPAAAPSAPVGVSAAPCPTGVVSEGDAQLKANTARANFAVDGTGVTVGVLSDSFNALGGAAGDVTAAELPGATNTCGYTTPVTVQADASGEDEGRAMAQIVHDLAPGSPLAFATAFNGVADFANQIRTLKNNGASVIVDDVTYFQEPMFQDGIIAKAVDDVVAGGAAYYSSAANNTITIGGHDVTSYETAAFRNTPCPTAIAAFEGAGTQCHNFSQSGTDAGDTITINAGKTIRLALSWNQPQGGVTTDLDMFLVDAATGAIQEGSFDTNAGLATGTEDPSEFFSFTNGAGAAHDYRIVVARYEGTDGGDSATPRFKIVNFLNGDTSVLAGVQYNTTSGNDIVGPTVIGHNGATRGATVAAVPYNNAAAVEPYSSHGPTKECWQPTTATAPPYTPPGAAINPCTTNTVDFAATDGGANSFFGGFSAGAFRFYGTSAAAPHAAAVGALARQKYPCRTPDEILAAQRAAAVPMAYSADVAGAGLVDANAMLGAISTCSPPTIPGAPISPVATAGNTTATVSWSAPASNGNSPITSYTVTSSPGNKTCTWTTGPLTCTVSGLTNGTSYTFTVFAHNAVGDGPPSVASNAVVPLPILYTAVTPTRVLDSRPATNVGAFASPWTAGTQRDVTIGDPTLVPVGAVAVVLNVTVTNTTAQSFLTLWPTGSGPRPTASSLNWTAGRTIPNAVTVKLGTSRQVSVYNLAGSADVVIDVAGYYMPGTGVGFTSTVPTRVLDSRPATNVGAFASPWTAGTQRDVTIGDPTLVPDGAVAVVLNVTVTNTTAQSFLTLWPTGSGPRPTASSLNWTAGRTIPNAVTVKLGTSRQVSVYNLAGSADVVIDVAGYYMAGGLSFHPVDPTRVLDSRPGTQVGVYNTPWGTGTTRAVTVGPATLVPDSADSVVLNTTVTNTAGQSFLTVWPTGVARPNASNLNWTAGVTIPNAVTVRLGTSRQVSVFNQFSTVDVITDVAGWFG